MMNTSDQRLSCGTPRLTRARALTATTLAFLAATVLPARAEESTVPADASIDTLFRAHSWLNGEPARSDLRGKVVLVDVFTFACINCQNITPNLRALARSKRQDLALIGVHTPETSYEKDRSQVITHFASLGVTWPVAIDNDFGLWNAYKIEYWPTQMIFDRRGKLRKVIIGDSQDAAVNGTVNALLREPA
jgi:thiol-disulfide isomerase/thioredoxin